MKKLKLQMQLSADGFVCGPNGELDWMTWNWDKPLKDFVGALTDSADTILMGRKMTDGFVSHWEDIVSRHHPSDDGDLKENYLFARKMVDYPKYVFSKTIRSHSGKNTTVVNGDLAEEVRALKSKPGRDLVVYGGAGFVTSLIDANLIDEYNLFINPTSIGNGQRIFSGRKNLKLADSKVYDCGIVVNTYSVE